MTPEQIKEKWGDIVMDSILDQLLGLSVHVLIEQILLRMPEAELERWACRILATNEQENKK
jgi:hypothetical protein